MALEEVKEKAEEAAELLVSVGLGPSDPKQRLQGRIFSGVSKLVDSQ